MYARADANSPNADALKSMPESHPSMYVSTSRKDGRGEENLQSQNCLVIKIFSLAPHPDKNLPSITSSSIPLQHAARLHTYHRQARE